MDLDRHFLGALDSFADTNVIDQSDDDLTCEVIDVYVLFHQFAAIVSRCYFCVNIGDILFGADDQTIQAFFLSREILREIHEVIICQKALDLVDIKRANTLRIFLCFF